MSESYYWRCSVATCDRWQVGLVREIKAAGWWQRRSAPGTTTAPFCPDHAEDAREQEKKRREAFNARRVTS